MIHLFLIEFNKAQQQEMLIFKGIRTLLMIAAEG
jgi:hypothetical protein